MLLIISLPRDEKSGRCRIDGQPCEYEIEGSEFRFRHLDRADPWNVRHIQGVIDDGERVRYLCGPALPPCPAWLPTHANLRKAVDDFDDALQAMWDTRGDDRDFLLLGHLDRPEAAEIARQFHNIDGLRTKAIMSGQPPFAACLLSPRFPEVMRKSGDPAHVATADELASFRDAGPPGSTGLLVLYPGGLWATPWAPARSGVKFVRYDPTGIS